MSEDSQGYGRAAWLIGAGARPAARRRRLPGGQSGGAGEGPAPLLHPPDRVARAPVQRVRRLGGEGVDRAARRHQRADHRRRRGHGRAGRPAHPLDGAPDPTGSSCSSPRAWPTWPRTSSWPCTRRSATTSTSWPSVPGVNSPEDVFFALYAIPAVAFFIFYWDLILASRVGRPPDGRSGWFSSGWRPRWTWRTAFIDEQWVEPVVLHRAGGRDRARGAAPPLVVGGRC